ncbi:MAG: START domain-containing protein [Thalassolituus oleivorans]|uniref:START domain-containing protein n=1 Tax=Thalassolituus oleivorans TaxID=187493 RepID=UPI001B7B7196|nr:START domain-containing protein [Thalassolituus oleivorans]MBQ0728373.1 START domain-containing protein [Thalassolituus oleivorans]MBQ0779779.1 START domain-containing protein [Thalassolituus oleivorans]
MLVLLSALSFSVVAADDWNEATYDKENDIRIFTRHVEGSDTLAFKAITHVTGRLTAGVALLQDAQRTKDWVFNCKIMEEIELISDTQGIYYMITNMPWPVKDRDSITETRVSQDQESLVVRVDMKARNDVFPSNDDFIRIREMNGYWLFTPKEGNQIEVIYEAHADPGGGLPSWLVNSFLVDAPLNTLRGFRQLIGEEIYQKADRAFIREAK